MAIINKDTRQSFIRGSDIAWHRLQLFLKNSWRLLLVSFAIAGIVFFLLTHLLATAEEREFAFDNRVSGLAQTLLLSSLKMNVSFFNKDTGREESAKLSVKKVKEVTQVAWDRVSRRIHFAMTVALLTGGFCGWTMFGYQVRRGKKYAEDEFLRGARFVPADELKQMLVDRNEVGDFEIGGIPIPQTKLARNILATGAMGTGKTQALLPLMFTARKLGKKAVVYDKTGVFTEHLYRPGIDVLLNPLDGRCSAWTVFNDLRKDFDFSQLASYFVAENKNSSDPVWDNAARILLEDAFRIVYGVPESERNMTKVADLIMKTPLPDLADLLRDHGCTSAGIINKDNQRGSESVRLTLSASPALRYFKYLPIPSAQNPVFSIRDWAEKDDDSWLFITSRSDQHEAIKPFVAVWIETALMSFMQQRPANGKGDNIRAMFFLDELASLQKMKALEIALTEARQFGIVSILGLQNLAQMDHVYGPDMTKVLVGNCQTKLILRVEDAETSRRYSQLLGEKDVEEKSEGNSFGEDPTRDGVNINSHRTERAIVMGSEITTLPDLVGFLKLPGDYPVAKINIEYTPREKVQPAYIPRDGLEIKASAPASVIAGSVEDRSNPEHGAAAEGEAEIKNGNSDFMDCFNDLNR
jgi:type IV conjugative transfer system coupling protein TraD